MADPSSKTVLCLASYEKGHAFIRECKRQGCTVLLLTTTALEHADWPREAIDEMFYVADLYNRNDVILGVSYMARTRRIDRIVPLDDYDVEMAATLREHLRTPGMGETTARYFRDKLAMRVQARDRGILVPDFIPVLNDDALRGFMARVPPPWVLKPRSEASSVGIKKVSAPEDLWPWLEALGDRQSFYLLERYIPGEVYHVDAITSENQIVFAEVHQYRQPPMTVAHEGGIFMTRTVPRGSTDEQTLRVLNRQIIDVLAFKRGVTHTEFIKSQEDGRFYFLETAARVGGANIVEMVEAATGLNLWAEWAKIEIAQGEWPYQLPPLRRDYAGVIISLAMQEYPDTSAYQESEIVYRLNKKHHVGFVIASPNLHRIEFLLDHYSQRFYTDFFAKLPPADKPTS
ncbi:MAG: ATP-grasp domain-containing protein [candidate division KSB1 bacterium]|nr:ATP-grasp domain-containing protein [candidate division KSB1 bacterium]